MNFAGAIYAGVASAETVLAGAQCARVAFAGMWLARESFVDMFPVDADLAESQPKGYFEMILVCPIRRQHHFGRSHRTVYRICSHYEHHWRRKSLQRKLRTYIPRID